MTVWLVYAINWGNTYYHIDIAANPERGKELAETWNGKEIKGWREYKGNNWRVLTDNFRFFVTKKEVKE